MAVPYPCKRRNYSNCVARILRQRFFPASLAVSLPVLPLFFSPPLSSCPFPAPFVPFAPRGSQIAGFRRHRNGGSLAGAGRATDFPNFSLSDAPDLPSFVRGDFSRGVRAHSAVIARSRAFGCRRGCRRCIAAATQPSTIFASVPILSKAGTRQHGVAKYRIPSGIQQVIRSANEIRFPPRVARSIPCSSSSFFPSFPSY